jgi:hypothetical protein
MQLAFFNVIKSDRALIDDFWSHAGDGRGRVP